MSKPTRPQNTHLMYLLLGLLVVVLYLILEPKISSILFPIKSKAYLNSFLTNIERSKQIDPKKFWEFREFYSQGTYTFNRFGLPPLNLAVTADYETAFLTFSSPKLLSTDYLTYQNSINDLISSTPAEADLLVETTNLYVSRKDNKIYIAFLMPVSQMAKANGFFEYNQPQDQALLKSKYWLDITEITN